MTSQKGNKTKNVKCKKKTVKKFKQKEPRFKRKIQEEEVNFLWCSINIYNTIKDNI